MSDETKDEINIGDVSNSQAIAAGRNARASVTNNYILPDYRPDAVYNLPQPNPHFVGRAAQLEIIAANFASAANPLVVTQAIAGLGGVGKTQLALAYAHTRRDQYDMLWLLRANDVPTLNNELRLLGVTLELSTPEVQDADVIRTKVLNHLSSSKKRWLLLYDNVDELTPRELRPYLPGGGHLLITSRRAAAHWQAFGQTLALDTFTEAEATAFWQERKLPTAPELATLAQELGYLPLALEQAAAFMQVQQLPAAEYLAWFREARDSLWAEEEAPTDYPTTVATTWQIGFDHARQRKGAAELLNLCCFLDPDGIPLDLIKQVATLPPVGARRDAPLHQSTLQEVVADERQLRLALTALRDYSLLRQADDGTIALHRLVQTVARDRLGQEQARAWVELAVDLLCKAYHYDEYNMSTWVAAGDLIPHLTAATELAAQLNCESENNAYLNNLVGFFLFAWGRYVTAISFIERALAVYKAVLGDDHPKTSHSLNNMGYLLQAMGRLDEASTFYEQALAIRQKVLGDNHPDTAQSLNTMGGLLRAMGRLEEARPFLEQALAIRQKVLDDDHPSTADSLNNMGGLLEAMGRLEKAQTFYEQALAIRQKVLGNDHPDTATSFNNMGDLLYIMGQFAEARPFYEQALGIRKRVLGDDHPNTATSLKNLAVLANHEEDYVESAWLMRQALVIREKRLGPDHPDTVNSREDLAAIEAKISS